MKEVLNFEKPKIMGKHQKRFSSLIEVYNMEINFAKMANKKKQFVLEKLIQL